MKRPDGRGPGDLRPVDIMRGYTRQAAGSVLIATGQTRVVCTACWEQGVPAWRKGSGLGWVTAEYDMLPGSTSTRRPRNRKSVDGRTQEIQRLIGRSLRAVVDMAALGENSILIDCDVLDADGGTRTAAITGAYVALCDAVRMGLAKEWIAASPSGTGSQPVIRQAVAAVSVGLVGGRAVLDLNYEEDAAAEVDMNLVMTEDGRFIEVQGTGEKATFTRAQMDRMLALAGRGIRELLGHQKYALGKRLKPHIQPGRPA